MEFSNQRRKNVRVFWVVIVIGTIQVGGHSRYPSVVMLTTHGLDLQNSCDLCNSVGLVGFFEGPCEQG